MKVRVTRDAAEDVRGIRSYIATHGDPVLANLALFPHIGHQGTCPAHSNCSCRACHSSSSIGSTTRTPTAS